MAISFCQAKKIVRTAKGRSAVSAAAYRAGEELHDEESGKDWKYKKDEVIDSKITLPENAPAEYKDRATLWNAVQKAEKQANAMLSRELVIALPNEFSEEQAKRVIDDFSQYLANEGMCVDAAIHWKPGNKHGHLMLTTRRIDKNGNWAKWKERKEYARDENGNKIPDLDENGNQKLRIRKGKGAEKLWKRVTVQENEWSKKTSLNKWKKELAKMMNRELEKSGVSDKVDYRSYAEQGSALIPQIHEGYAARAIEKRGGKSWKCEKNRKIRAINKEYLDKKEALEKELIQVREDKAATVELVPWSGLESFEKQAVSDKMKFKKKGEWTEKQINAFASKSVFVRENGGGVHLFPVPQDKTRAIMPIFGKITPRQAKAFMMKLRKSGYYENRCNEAQDTFKKAQKAGIAKAAGKAKEVYSGAKAMGAAATLKGARGAMSGAMDSQKDSKSHAVDALQNVGEIFKTPFEIAKDMITNPVTGILKGIVRAFKAVDSAVSAAVNVGAAGLKYNKDKDYGLGSNNEPARVRSKSHDSGPRI